MLLSFLVCISADILQSKIKAPDIRPHLHDPLICLIIKKAHDHCPVNDILCRILGIELPLRLLGCTHQAVISAEEVRKVIFCRLFALFCSVEPLCIFLDQIGISPEIPEVYPI